MNYTIQKIGQQKGIFAITAILLIILIDQITKIYIKTHFFLGESVEVFSWFHIRFIENNGMAFGVELFDKIFLTIFRIVAVGFIGYYLHKIIKKDLSLGYILAIAALLAGAFGNIIDCAVYGLIFDSSQYQIASFLPEGGGYAPLFYGKVVDMLYFPLISTDLPEWLPFFGGKHFTFFDAIFNIADSAITISIFYLILFQRSLLKKEFGEEKKQENNAQE